MASTNVSPDQAAIDPTDRYVMAHASELNGDRILWEVRADVRGSYPGYLTLPPMLSSARIRLTPVFLCATTAQHGFCIPNSAIERIVLTGSQTRPQLQVLLIDYCDADGTLRRCWLRLRRQSQVLQAFLPGSRIGSRFLLADIPLTVPAIIVPGLSHFEYGQFSSDEVIWSGQVSISLASGDCVACLRIMPDRIRCELTEYTLDIPLSTVCGYEIQVDRIQQRRYLFVSFDEQDHRIDLRMQTLSSSSLPSSPDTLDQLVDTLDRLDVPPLRASPTAHVSAPENQHNDQSPQSASEPMKDDSVAGWQRKYASSVPQDLPNASNDRHTASSVSPTTFEWRPNDLVNRARQQSVDGVAQPETILEEQVVKRLRIANLLHAQGLINDKELNGWRARILTDAHHVQQLHEVHVLNRIGLMTGSEFEEWRYRIIAELFG